MVGNLSKSPVDRAFELGVLIPAIGGIIVAVLVLISFFVYNYVPFEMGMFFFLFFLGWVVGYIIFYFTYTRLCGRTVMKGSVTE